MIRHFCDYCGKEAADWHRDIPRWIIMKPSVRGSLQRKLMIDYHLGGSRAHALCDDCVTVLIREAADAFEAQLKKERSLTNERQ